MKNKKIVWLYSIMILGLVLILTNSCKKDDKGQVPILTTNEVSNIKQTTASCGGSITAEGSSTITVRGVCWGTGITPTISDSKTNNGAGAGNFTSAITDLSPNTLYYVRAYSTNSIGTGYGMAMSFTTLQPIQPVVSTSTVSNITHNTATCGGNVTSDGGAAITARGVCWGTTQNPTIAVSHTTDSSGVGSFTSNITGLNLSTTYYVRAYATNSKGTSYGSQVIFNTSGTPTITTATITGITTTTATSGGNITSNGGATITASGVCWSTSASPIATGSHTSDGTATGVFTSSITGLTAGTLYYVRAYATNSAGTSYGNEVNFTTLLPPTITNFPAITKVYSNVPFTLTPPTSNSTGAFSYSISNTDIATISGSTVSIIGVGTCTITATQAATTSYTSGNITTSFTVNADPLTISDVDGNIYNVIHIGTQLWLKENLKTTKYSNGSPITNITDNTAWVGLTSGAYGWYNNEIANKNIYGALYNHYAVVDINKLCPTGWHVPTDEEWHTLVLFLDASSHIDLTESTTAGGKLKATTLWNSPNTGADNSSGFTALPGGDRLDLNGNYYTIGDLGYWWSATENSTNAWYRYLDYSSSAITRYNVSKKYGFSVRCLMDL